MTNSGFVNGRHRWLRNLSFALVWLFAMPFLPTAMGAQEKNAPAITIGLKYDEAGTKYATRGGVASNAIYLRPNTQQRVFLFATSNKFNLENVKARLLTVANDGSTTQVAVSQTITKLPKGKSAPIVFGKPKPAEPKKSDPKKPVKGGIALDGPPFELQLVFEGTKREDKSRIVVPHMLPVQFIYPSEYVRATATAKETKLATSLKFLVSKGKDFYGPACPLRLDISPKIQLDLKTIRTSGTYRQVLLPRNFKPRPNKEPVVMETGPLRYRRGSARLRRVYLTVDGYERAFMWTTSDTKGELGRLSGTRIRLLTPRYAPPTPKIAVQLEVDNPPVAAPRSPGSVDAADRPYPLYLKLDLLGGAEGRDVVIPLKKLRGHRSQKVTVVPSGPGGCLVLTTEVKPWAIELNTEDVFGTNRIRAQLLRYNPLQKQFEQIALVNEFDEDSESMISLSPGSVTSPYAPLQYGSLIDTNGVVQEEKFGSVAATVLIDATNPKITEFGREAKKRTKHVRGTPLVLNVKVWDPESGIRKVVFFAGPLKKKIPETAIVGILAKPVKNFTAPQVWQVSASALEIPTDKAGKYAINVAATNQAGMTSTDTIRLELVDPEPKEKPKKPKDKKKNLFDVSGRALVGGRAQPNVSVFLADQDNKIKGATKTDAKGNWEFKDVAPGVYRVTAVREALKLRGDKLITVPLPKDGKKVKTVDITLKRN